MLPRKRDIMVWSIALIIMMIGLTIYFLRERIPFYWNTKDLSASPIGNYDPGNVKPATPNVDLGFVSFHLELSPEATIKQSEASITVKDQGRTLVINLPEVFAEMLPNPNAPDDLLEFDRLIEKYGNIVLAQKAAINFKSDIGVLFCSDNDFKCYQSLLMMRLVPTPRYERKEFYTTPSFDAIIDTIRTNNDKFTSITWSTKQGTRKDQRRGVIMVGDKSPSQNTNWPNRLIHSMIMHPQSDVLSVDEMVKRLEKLKQLPSTRPGG